MIDDTTITMSAHTTVIVTFLNVTDKIYRDHHLLTKRTEYKYTNSLLRVDTDNTFIESDKSVKTYF